MGHNSQPFLSKFFEDQRAKVRELDQWKTPSLYSPSEALERLESMKSDLRNLQAQLVRQQYEVEALRRQVNLVEIALENA